MRRFSVCTKGMHLHSNPLVLKVSSIVVSSQLKRLFSAFAKNSFSAFAISSMHLLLLFFKSLLKCCPPDGIIWLKMILEFFERMPVFFKESKSSAHDFMSSLPAKIFRAKNLSNSVSLKFLIVSAKTFSFHKLAPACTVYSGWSSSARVEEYCFSVSIPFSVLQIP